MTDNKETNVNELKLNEMEEVVGGSGGSKNPLPERAGYIVYWIQRGDTLTKIARRYGTTAQAIKAANSTIHNINDITADYYIYVPVGVGR